MTTLGSVLPNSVRTPERGSVLEFAEKHRIISSETAIPGLYSSRLFPYQREPQESFGDPDVEEIFLMWASQLGKSVVIENMLFYCCVGDPGPSMWTLPDEKSQIAFRKKRFEPAIRETRRWSDELIPGGNSITQTMAEFRRMTVYLALAASEADLAQKSIRYIYADEIDKFPAATKKEGSPLDQLRARTRTFAGKLVGSSTPTTHLGSVYQAFLEAQQWEWCVPCPHCDEKAPWHWEQVKWEKKPKDISYRDYAERIRGGDVEIWYECPYCSKGIDEGTFSSMQERGEYLVCSNPLSQDYGWIKRLNQLKINKDVHWYKPEKRSRKIAYHASSISTLFSPIRTLVADWMDALQKREEGSDDKIKHFVIHQLGMPYTSKRVHLEASVVTDRVDSSYPKGMIPEWARVVTRGIDVQHDRFYIVVSAWGDFARRHILHHECLYGGFEELEEHLLTPFTMEGRSNAVTPHLTLIDSGDGLMAQQIYNFCLKFSGKRVRPVHGRSPMPGGKVYMENEKHIESGGLIVTCGSNEVSDRIAGMLRIEPGAKGSTSYHQGVLNDEDFQKQIVSEHRILENGKMVWRVRKGYQNHFRDADKYDVAAGYMKRVFEFGIRGEQKKKKVIIEKGWS